MEVAVTLVVAYLLGSVPVAGLVARRHGVADLRAVGDENPGYWNAKETLGRRAALPVFVGDAAKGALAAGLGIAVAGDEQWWLAYVATGAAMLGHAYPVFAGFRGGRSVLTFVGGFAVYAPVAALVAGVVLLGVWGLTRRFDVAARTSVVALPIAQVVLDGPVRTAATGVLMAFIGLRFAQAARRTRGRATFGAG